MKNGINGEKSRFHDSFPCFHQKITSNAAGSVAVTDLDINPKIKSASAKP